GGGSIEIPPAAGRPEEIRAVPVRHRGRWVAAALILLFGASLIHSVATNKLLEWHVVGQFLFDQRILEGVVLTIELTVSAMTLGVLLGVALAVMRLSPNPLVSGSSWLYIWFFRATPVLVQLLFWYNVAAIYPRISLGIPFVGVEFLHGSANTVVTTYVAALLGLGLNEGAYMAEIVRAGIISVGEGQTHAAQSLGMSRLQIMRRIVLPQAMRVIIPPTGNETISMLKTSSLASVITLTELLLATENIYSVNFKPIQLLIVASIWYAAMTSVLYVGQYYLERHYARGAARELPATPLERIRRGLFSLRRERALP
ncbi:MAG TPA: amino acid ABC transporter permease, partial [Gaiellaceae bacterium]|nr:amino acid ABC transporter permease [Gaiellaceae bacterium]